MIETAIELENGEFILLGRVEVSEEEPRVSVFYDLKSPHRTEMNLEIRLIATNPIGIDDVIIGTATAYGLCIATKLTYKTLKETIKCYRQSKNDNPDFSILDHAIFSGACIASKGGLMKDTAIEALVDCLKIPKDDDGDESSDGGK